MTDRRQIVEALERAIRTNENAADCPYADEREMRSDGAILRALKEAIERGQEVYRSDGREVFVIEWPE
jgi:hypothetical protein